MLRVLARDTTGFHQIETVFGRIALADDVAVRLTAHGRTLDCRGADIGRTEDNLAYRAAAAYAAGRGGWPRGFAIEIDKRIPVGGGLGGGSADAGAVLRILRALDPAPPADATLLALAAALGADVPFLTLDDPLALAWGRGDRLLPLPALPPRPLLLAIPLVRVATHEAYAWLDAADALDRGPLELPCGGFADWDAVEPFLGNAFEGPVVAHRAEIGAVLAALRRLPGIAPRHVLLSGSGSAVYALLDGEPAAVPPAIEGATMLVTSTVARVAGVERIA
jgi:4-diphosphocytidyl-2-C-methyl-D-erythritol kinase